MASKNIVKEAAFFIAFIFLFLNTNIFADVSVKVGVNCDSFSMTNATPLSWKIGGIRFYDNGVIWTSVQDGEGAGWTMTNANVGGRIRQDLYFKSVAQGIDAPSGSKLSPGVTTTFRRSWNTDTGSAYPDMYVLLHTGSPGVPDEPTDASPITLKQLDSLLALPGFYNAAYRYDYVDSLGVNGGRYSGGFIDTWYNRNDGKAETQLLFPIPPNPFTLNNPGINFDTSATNGPMYWMTLACGQEYFHADMQWMAAMGIKENNAGVKSTQGINVTYNPNTAHSSGYGPWQVEFPTGADRALTYPSFFPKYTAQLAAAKDVGSSPFLTAFAFMDYYCGLTAPIGSASIMNCMVFSVLVQYTNYDVFSYCTDICWKQALAAARDPYMGLAAMVMVYNIGNSTVTNVAARLNSNTYAATCNLAAPAARNLFPANNNYTADMLTGVQNLIDASRASQTNAAIKMLDYRITEPQLMAAFFGDNGTVAAQGTGGLLLHFYDPTATNCIPQRQQIWNTLDSAFNKLKGRAPSTTGTSTISYRYDLLSILRTVKGNLSFKRNPPAGGDATNNIIPQNSGHYPSCSGAAGYDETYPYPTTTMTILQNGNVTAVTTVTDETQAKSVKWTMDYKWGIWNDATPVDTTSQTNRTFSFTALKSDIDLYKLQPDGYSGKYFWIMSTDASGNSTVQKVAIAGIKYPTLDSAIIQDVNGDGWGDKITAYVTKAASDSADPVGAFNAFQYSWPNQTNLVQAVKANVIATATTLTYTDQTLAAGAGLGSVVLDYPSKTGISTNLFDRVGPALATAISRATLAITVPDTLVIGITEPIKNLTQQAGTAYLNFKPAGVPTKTAVPSTAIVKQGNTGASWLFILPPGTIAQYDSVNFVNTTGQIFDTVGNPPLAINRMVKIQKTGGKYPSLDSAIIQDANGDGLGDKITAYMTKSNADGADSLNNFTSFKYSWPTQSSLITANKSTVIVAANTLTYSDQALTAGSGLGLLVLDYPSLTGITAAIKDRVGPALTTALSKATKNASVPETLLVATTEPLKNLSPVKIPILNFKSANGAGKTAIAATTIISQGSAGNAWMFILPGGSLAPYDSVNFVSTSAQVFDTVGNPPLDINRMVKIQKQSFVVTLKEMRLTAIPNTGTIAAGDSVVFTAHVFDDTGGVRPEYDAQIAWPQLTPAGTRSSLRTQTGTKNTFYGIDAYRTYAVKAQFTDPANPSNPLSAALGVNVVWGKETRVVIEPDTFSNLNNANPDTLVAMDPTANSDTVYAVVRDAYGNFCRRATAAQWASVDAGVASVNGAVAAKSTGIILRQSFGSTYVIASEPALQSDSVRVVIAKAELTALRLINAGTGDTIRSIAMKDDQQIPIKAIGTMSNAPGTWTTVASSWTLNPATIGLAIPLPFGPDTAWRLSPLSAGQTNLTVTSGAKSITVPVKVTSSIKVTATIACDNPFSPGISQIPAAKRNTNDPAFGTRIEVKLSAPPVDNAGTVLFVGNVTIYDAVGNCIADKKEMKPDQAALYVIWDGNNRRNARVAPGNYLGKIELINKTDNTSIIVKTIIGVR